jgi:hypothetical protein
MTNIRGRRDVRRTIIHRVDLRYKRQELLALFALAVKEDVDKGGRYDARSNAINIWSHPRTPQILRQESSIMGTFHCTWGVENCIYQIETDLGFSFDHLMRELGALEMKALNQLRYGSQSVLPTAILTKKSFGS